MLRFIWEHIQMSYHNSALRINRGAEQKFQGFKDILNWSIQTAWNMKSHYHKVHPFRTMIHQLDFGILRLFISEVDFRELYIGNLYGVLNSSKMCSDWINTFEFYLEIIIFFKSLDILKDIQNWWFATSRFTNN